MEAEYISQAEFARRVDSSRARVNVLVQQGRLPTNSKKQIPWIEGKAIWDTCRDVQYTPQALIGKAKKGKHPTTSVTAEQAAIEVQVVKEVMQEREREQEPEDDEPEVNEKVELNTRLTVAKVKKEEALAAIKELEKQALQGKYVAVDVVRQDAANLGAKLRERLLAIPKRVSVVCEGRPAVEIEIEVEKEINETLKLFQEKRF